MQPKKFILNNKNILPRFKISLKTNMTLLIKTIYFPESVIIVNHHKITTSVFCKFLTFFPLSF